MWTSMIVGLLVVLSGCVTPTVIKPASESINFRAYKSVKLEVKDWVKSPYSEDGIPMLDGLLRGKLRSLGYTLVDSSEDMTVGVNVTEFTPGSAAARFFLGFGAGRALLVYRAKFIDPTGFLIAEFEGGKSYHGMELADNPLYKTDEEIKMGMIQQAAIQLGQFIQSNGRLDGSSKEKATEALER